MPPRRLDRGVRRIVLCGLATVSGVVLLFSYRTSTSPDPPAEAAGTADGPAAAVPPAAPSTGRSSSGGAWSGTVTGPVVRIQWGEVQVRATIERGRITAVDVLRTPDENTHDRQVNARAVPVLVRETIAAQSSRIDMVSGATFTSTGYVQSLQAALDRAGTA
ncbi:FMN-binding protein [Actinomycetospora endophytica]|uniref:FMN-binding protein n=1 Tax=Actinomycetospora endophytica TaxID=2291215 RepID=A0ABS8P437_9PSEU|nr:FMN-binding protein [Actinomycetospora endophytica]MCD2193017.1 FMN-binding protein [Actinomycetospora endophytica]